MISVLARKTSCYGCRRTSAAIVAKVTRASAPFSTLSDERDDNDDQHQQQQYPTKNIRLEAIKSVGITQLHNTTQDLISRTRQPLFEESLVDAQGQKKKSIAQIQEGNRLESAIIDALAHYSSKYNTFSVGGQCIDLLGVEVSPDLKQCKAYWKVRVCIVLSYEFDCFVCCLGDFTTSFDLGLPIFDHLYKPYTLTKVTITSLHLHKL